MAMYRRFVDFMEFWLIVLHFVVAFIVRFNLLTIRMEYEKSMDLIKIAIAQAINTHIFH